MKYRPLGSTGIAVSEISFGAGPVSQLLVGETRKLQRTTLERAIEGGVNWFDTAATYGAGQSEVNLGLALADLDPKGELHVATKVRLRPEDIETMAEQVSTSLESSLRRLRRPRVSLLQLHNSITRVSGAQPTSITPGHVLAPGGLLDQFELMKSRGLVEHLGLTGLGEPAALAEVIACGRFATVQVPYNVLNPSAGQQMPLDFKEENYGDVIALCGRQAMGVFAIRVLAGGALASQPPSPHTLKTPFFPLELFERDRMRADALSPLLPHDMRCEEAAVRFALSHPFVTSTIIGLGSPAEVSETLQFAAAGPMDPGLIARLTGAIQGET